MVKKALGRLSARLIVEVNLCLISLFQNFPSHNNFSEYAAFKFCDDVYVVKTLKSVLNYFLVHIYNLITFAFQGWA